MTQGSHGLVDNGLPRSAHLSECDLRDERQRLNSRNMLRQNGYLYQSKRMEHSPGSSPDDLPPRSAPQGQDGEDVPAMAPPAASREGTDTPDEPDRSAPDGSTDSSGTGRKGFVVFGWISVLLGIIVLAARIFLVRIGALYGTSPVSQVNAIAGAFIVIGFALIASRNAGKTRGRRN